MIQAGNETTDHFIMSNESSRCPLPEPVDYVRLLTVLIGAPFGILGIFTNGILIFLFMGSKYRSSPTLYLAFLAVLDVLICLMYVLIFPVDALAIYYKIEWLWVAWHKYSMVLYAVGRIVHLASTFLVVCATLERFLITWKITHIPIGVESVRSIFVSAYPRSATAQPRLQTQNPPAPAQSQHQQRTTASSACRISIEFLYSSFGRKLVIFTVFVIATGLRLPSYFEYSVVPTNCQQPFTTFGFIPNLILSYGYREIYNLYIMNAVQVFLPFIILLTCNILILFKMRLNLRTRRSSSSSHHQQQTPKPSRNSVNVIPNQPPTNAGSHSISSSSSCQHNKPKTSADELISKQNQNHSGFVTINRNTTNNSNNYSPQSTITELNPTLNWSYAGNNKLSIEHHQNYPRTRSSAPTAPAAPLHTSFYNKGDRLSVSPAAAAAAAAAGDDNGRSPTSMNKHDNNNSGRRHHSLMLTGDGHDRRHSQIHISKKNHGSPVLLVKSPFGKEAAAETGRGEQQRDNVNEDRVGHQKLNTNYAGGLVHGRTSETNWRHTLAVKATKTRLKAVTYTIVAMVTSYLICGSFDLTIKVLENIAKDLLISSDRWLQFYRLSTDIISILFTVNSFLRLPIYLLCNRNVRVDFINLFCRIHTVEIRGQPRRKWNHVPRSNPIHNNNTLLLLSADERACGQQWTAEGDQQDVVWMNNKKKRYRGLRHVDDPTSTTIGGPPSSSETPQNNDQSDSNQFEEPTEERSFFDGLQQTKKEKRALSSQTSFSPRQSSSSNKNNILSLLVTPHTNNNGKHCRRQSSICSSFSITQQDQYQDRSPSPSPPPIPSDQTNSPDLMTTATGNNDENDEAAASFVSDRFYSNELNPGYDDITIVFDRGNVEESVRTRSHHGPHSTSCDLHRPRAKIQPTLRCSIQNSNTNNKQQPLSSQPIQPSSQQQQQQRNGFKNGKYCCRQPTISVAEEAAAAAVHVSPKNRNHHPYFSPRRLSERVERFFGGGRNSHHYFSGSARNVSTTNTTDVDGNTISSSGGVGDYPPSNSKEPETMSTSLFPPIKPKISAPASLSVPNRQQPPQPTTTDNNGSAVKREECSENRPGSNIVFIDFDDYETQL